MCKSLFSDDVAEVHVLVKAPNKARGSRHFLLSTDTTHNTYVPHFKKRIRKGKKKPFAPEAHIWAKPDLALSCAWSQSTHQTLNSCSEVCKLSCPIKDGELGQTVIMNNGYDNLSKRSTFEQFYSWSSLCCNSAGVQIYLST